MMRPSGLNIMAGIAADTKEVVVEIIALECEAVGLSAKVGPKAGTYALASIWHIRSGTARHTFAIIAIGVNAIGAAVAPCAPIAHCGRSPPRARGSSDIAALRIERALANYIDYAIGVIGSPQGPTCTATNPTAVDFITHKLPQAPKTSST